MLGLTILISLVQLFLALPLEGVWILDKMHDTNIILRANFSYYVFRNQSVMGKIQVEGCELLSYQFSIEYDNIYIDTENVLVQPVRNCSASEGELSQNIQWAMKDVLKFSTYIDRLSMMTPAYEQILSFQRFKNPTYSSWQKNISGSWMVNMVGDQQNSYGMIVNETYLSICSGATFNYNITRLYYAQASLQSSGACKDQNLISNILKVAFYRKFDQRLEFYDNSINLLFSGIFNSNASSDVSIAVQPSIVTSTINIATSGPAAGFVAGKYSLLLVDNKSLDQIQVSVTSKAITFQLCSLLVFNYNLVGDDKIQIKSQTTAALDCQKGNESLYVNSLQQSNKYRIEADGTITLMDGSYRPIVTLAQ